MQIYDLRFTIESTKMERTHVRCYGDNIEGVGHGAADVAARRPYLLKRLTRASTVARGARALPFEIFPAVSRMISRRGVRGFAANDYRNLNPP